MMSLTLSSVTSAPLHQDRYYREVNSTIERLNAGVQVRPKDDPAAFMAYELNRSRENQLKTAGVNADRAQAFGSQAMQQLDRVGSALDELRELYVSDEPGAQRRIDELLETINQINDEASFNGTNLFPTRSPAADPSASGGSTSTVSIPTVGGIVRGYADGDLTFDVNFWDGQANAGEFNISGTQFSRLGDSDSVDPTTLGSVRAGIAASDAATGQGYILHSTESVHTRFSPQPFDGNSDHLIAVVYEQGQWYYDDNSNLQAFTPVASDVLLAEVDFTADTITNLRTELAPVAVNPRQELEPTAFQFSGSQALRPGELTLELDAVAAATLGTADHQLTDLASGGALAHAYGDRTQALETIDAALGQIDRAQQQVLTFVRTTVGGLDRVNQANLTATTAMRESFESRASLEAAQDARRLMLQSAGQSLVQKARQDQADTLLSLIEQNGSRSLSRPDGASLLSQVHQAQQTQLSEALTAFTAEANAKTSTNLNPYRSIDRANTAQGTLNVIG